MQIGADTVESSMEIPRETKNGSAFWHSNPTSGNISEGTQNTNLKKHKHPYVQCSVIYNYQDLEATQMSISRWVYVTTMDIYIMECYSGIKKKKITIWDSMDGPKEHYAKWNKPVIERHTPYDFIHM